jgi:hypothetical protein
MKENARPPRRRQVAIEIGGKMVEIDVGIAPLVAALNKLPGIETVSSCQESDRKDLASVSFGVSTRDGRPAADAAVCHALRQIDRALTVAGLWSDVRDLLAFVAFNLTHVRGFEQPSEKVHKLVALGWRQGAPMVAHRGAGHIGKIKARSDHLA